MLKKYPFITGTLLLTITGLLTRVIGFFYRVFLSRTIGEEGMGIYQLLAPVMALSFSLTCAGIQTSISKFTASYVAKKKVLSSLHVLLVGFSIALSLSVLCTFILYQNDYWIAKNLLLEVRCAPLIRIYALALPFSCVHSCINGYYYGLKKAAIPSLSQLVEQIARVGSVFLIFNYSYKIHSQPTLSVAMFGILIGETCSMLLSVIAIYVHFSRIAVKLRLTMLSVGNYITHSKEIMSLALPLMGNRLVLNGLQSIEAVYIPNRLMYYGLSNSDALKNYGVLTGMTFPLILFPSAITSSVSVLLLPYISEAQAINDKKKIKAAIQKCIISCLLLGSLCCIFFLIFGGFLGKFLFGSELAGQYNRVLSIACPVLYMGGVLTSILHGLGKAFRAFIYNTICLLIRLAFVFFMIPVLGMYGYLIGILVSQLLFALIMIYELRSYLFAR